MARQATLESDLLKTLQTSCDLQLKHLSPDVHEKIAIVKQRHSLKYLVLYSQLAITRENAFLKSKQEADEEAKKAKS